MLVTLIILTIRIPTLNGNQVFTVCKITKIFAYMQMNFRRLRCGGNRTQISRISRIFRGGVGLNTVTCPGYSLRNSKLKTVLKMNYDKRRTDYEKMLIIKDYCETDISRGEIIEKYKLRGEGSLMEWIRKFVDPNIKRVIDMKGRKIQLPPAPGVESLEEENARLRKELELAQLRAEGLEIMIDLAEKQFKIPIRKKSGAKR